jgi:hypothetical protein
MFAFECYKLLEKGTLLQTLLCNVDLTGVHRFRFFRLSPRDKKDDDYDLKERRKTQIADSVAAKQKNKSKNLQVGVIRVLRPSEYLRNANSSQSGKSVPPQATGWGEEYCVTSVAVIVLVSTGAVIIVIVIVVMKSLLLGGCSGCQGRGRSRGGQTGTHGGRV